MRKTNYLKVSLFGRIYLLKGKFHITTKKYRNLLSILMNKINLAYDNKYFETNWNNTKKTWKGIKPLISLKTVASSVPTVLFLDKRDIKTNLYDTASTFKPLKISLNL